jgi:hypothetical protein
VRPLHLARQRDVSTLFRDTLAILWGNLWTFLALGAAVVVPVELVVRGIGMEELTASYDAELTTGEAAVTVAVTFLVVVPLLTAICIHALKHVAEGERPRAREAVVAGFEDFTPVFFAVAIAALGIALGFALLILPGIYVLVRWLFVPQAVVLEGDRQVEALRRSTEVTQGFWWRTLGLAVLANVAIVVPSLLLTTPFAAIAEGTDRAVWNLVGTMLGEIVTAPFITIFYTLMWFDLRARRSIPR